jgi:hypothetical protein
VSGQALRLVVYGHAMGARQQQAAGYIDAALAADEG